MGQIVPIFSNFSLGEVDERLFGHSGLELNKKGAKRIRNMLVTQEANITRRFGLEYVTTLSLPTDKTEVRLFLFQHNNRNIYDLVFEDMQLTIYLDGVVQATLHSPYHADHLSSLKEAVSFDIVIFTHEDIHPTFLRKNSVAPQGWELVTLHFENYPSAIVENLLTGFEFTLSGGTDPANPIHGTTKTPLIITSDTADAFFDELIHGLFFGNGGILRITEVVGTTVIKGFTITDFLNDDVIEGRTVVLTQPAWSSTFGWPRNCTFIQNRLTFGGSPQFPNGMWGSVTNDWSNFDDSSPEEATNGLTTYLETGATNIITDILGAQTLFIFTDSGIASSSQISGPITPTNISFNLQSSEPTFPLKSIYHDGQVMAVDGGGHIVRNFVYNDVTNAYDGKPINLVSKHLMDSPTSLAVSRMPDNNNGVYLFFTNDDGSLVSYQSVLSEKISAWTLCTTDGYFRHVAAVRDQVHFITERTINGATVFYLEKVNFNGKADASLIQTFGTSTTVITGLSHLEGETVKVIGDGNIFDDEVVSGGQITLETGVTSVEVGMDVVPLLVPFPVVAQIPQLLTNMYRPKLIKSIYIDYHESLGIYVDNQLLSDFQFNQTVFDAAPDPLTGFSLVSPMVGWDPRAEIQITQQELLPFTIIGLGMLVELDT